MGTKGMGTKETGTKEMGTKEMGTKEMVQVRHQRDGAGAAPKR